MRSSWRVKWVISWKVVPSCVTGATCGVPPSGDVRSRGPVEEVGPHCLCDLTSPAGPEATAAAHALKLADAFTLHALRVPGLQ